METVLDPQSQGVVRRRVGETRSYWSSNLSGRGPLRSSSGPEYGCGVKRCQRVSEDSTFFRSHPTPSQSFVRSCHGGDRMRLKIGVDPFVSTIITGLKIPIGVTVLLSRKDRKRRPSLFVGSRGMGLESLFSHDMVHTIPEPIASPRTL